MISEALAISKAREAIAGRITLQEGAPVEVRSQGGHYVVTFIHMNPPHTLGPDFDAQVHIDAETGELVEPVLRS
jgi:hypothetical protein